VTVTSPTPVGDPTAGQVKYDADCSPCHAAGTHDTSDGGGGDLAGKGQLLVTDLGSISAVMDSVAPLTDQEILDLTAFLDNL
jgi:mono/diheme cytochrome c family protein